MKKIITIAIAIALFALFCWGTYAYVKSSKIKVLNAGAQVGLIYGNSLGMQAGFTNAGDAILKQLREEGKLTITFNDAEGNSQMMTLIPLVE